MVLLRNCSSVKVRSRPLCLRRLAGWHTLSILKVSQVTLLWGSKQFPKHGARCQGSPFLLLRPLRLWRFPGSDGVQKVRISSTDIPEWKGTFCVQGSASFLMLEGTTTTHVHPLPVVDFGLRSGTLRPFLKCPEWREIDRNLSAQVRSGSTKGTHNSFCEKIGPPGKLGVPIRACQFLETPFGIYSNII